MKKGLLQNTTQLYLASLLSILPLSILITALYLFIVEGHIFFAPNAKPLQLQISVFIGVFLWPLLMAIITKMDALIKKQPLSYQQLFIFTCARFLSLIGCTISMVLIPAIVLGVCLVIYVAMGVAKFSWEILFFWEVLTYFLVFATITTKIFAPILVFTDQLDANSAQDKSELIVKNHYFYTYLYSFFAILLFIFWDQFPNSLQKIIHLPMTHYELIGVRFFLLMIFGPWSLALLLMLKNELTKHQK